LYTFPAVAENITDDWSEAQLSSLHEIGAPTHAAVEYKAITVSKAARPQVWMRCGVVVAAVRSYQTSAPMLPQIAGPSVFAPTLSIAYTPGPKMGVAEAQLSLGPRRATPPAPPGFAAAAGALFPPAGCPFAARGGF
jgi:hypothetical protein